MGQSSWAGRLGDLSIVITSNMQKLHEMDRFTTLIIPRLEQELPFLLVAFLSNKSDDSYLIS